MLHVDAEVIVLASGALDGTVTSAGTAASQKYWEFLDYAYLTNHAWTTNYLAVNLDAWNKLSPQGTSNPPPVPLNPRTTPAISRTSRAGGRVGAGPA